MDSEILEKNEQKLTGRRYGSVRDLIRGERLPHEIEERVRQLGEETRITRILASMRVKAGLTQEEMGKLLGCSQPAISKLESGRDEELTLKEIRDYANSLNGRVSLLFGPQMNHVEAINAHAMAMRDRMFALAKLAGEDAEMEKSIQAFFGDALFKILSILAASLSQLPDKGSGIMVQFSSQPAPRPSEEKAPREEACV